MLAALCVVALLRTAASAEGTSAAGAPPLRATCSVRTLPASKRSAAPIIFSIVYVILYPALPGFSGHTKGLLGYSSRAELERLRQSNTPGLSALLPEKINYSRGNLLFWYRDYDRAISELRRLWMNIEEFYRQGGLAASRANMQGRGRVSGVTQKDGASQYRRADSIPVR